MKGATVLSEDAELIDAFARSLRARGIEHDVSRDAVVTIDRASGYQFMLERIAPELAWSWQVPPHIPEPGVAMPDLMAVFGYGGDCRSEEYFAQMGGEVARASDKPVWVVDEADVVWDAANVDPARVVL